MAAVCELAECIDETPIVVCNAPGFVVNRIVVPMINEAFLVLADLIDSMTSVLLPEADRRAEIAGGAAPEVLKPAWTWSKSI